MADNRDWMDRNSWFLDLTRNYIIISWVIDSWRPLCFIFGSWFMFIVIVARPPHSGYILLISLVLLAPSIITVLGWVSEGVQEANKQIENKKILKEIAEEEAEIAKIKWDAFLTPKPSDKKLREAILSKPASSPPSAPSDAPPDAIWYYTQGKSSRGPVSYSKLKELAKTSMLAREDKVWRAGVKDWEKPEVFGLFD